MTSKELIYRQQAIEALGEAPKFKIGLLKKYAEGRNDQWFDDVAALVNLPSAQPEIVRCKDCKHYQFADNRAFGMPVKMCTWFGFEDVDDNDFCSWAERWEE